MTEKEKIDTLSDEELGGVTGGFIVSGEVPGSLSVVNNGNDRQERKTRQSSFEEQLKLSQEGEDFANLLGKNEKMRETAEKMIEKLKELCNK